MASGFTLSELLAVIAVLGVLICIALPVIQPMRERAERLVCMGNLRSFHVAMSAYLGDHKRWPQSPPEASDEEYDNFWLSTMKPYGISERAWLCPSIARKSKHENLNQSELLQASRLHYLPTDFDDKAITPHLYPTHPWLMEIGGPHGRGNMIIWADGSIHELMELIKQVEEKKSLR